MKNKTVLVNTSYLLLILMLMLLFGRQTFHQRQLNEQMYKNDTAVYKLEDKIVSLERKIIKLESE